MNFTIYILLPPRCTNLNKEKKTPEVVVVVVSSKTISTPRLDVPLDGPDSWRRGRGSSSPAGVDGSSSVCRGRAIEVEAFVYISKVAERLSSPCVSPDNVLILHVHFSC